MSTYWGDVSQFLTSAWLALLISLVSLLIAWIFQRSSSKQGDQIEEYSEKVARLTDNLGKNQIQEKVAVLYGYADQFGLNIRTPNILKRVEADIKAMDAIRDSIKGGEGDIRDAGDAMFTAMITRYPPEDIERLGRKFNELFR